MNAARHRWVFLLIVACCGVAAAEEKPSALRRQVAKAEAEFFALYNELNTEPQYHMVCRMERPTGTNFATRVCQPRFVETAQGSNAADRLHTAINAGPGADSTNPGAPALFWQHDGFRRNVESVLGGSAKLQAIRDKRDALQARLDALTPASRPDARPRP